MQNISKCAWFVFQYCELDRVTAVVSPYTTGSTLDLFLNTVNKRGLIPVILVVCVNSAVVQNMVQIYGIAVPLASEHAGTCWRLSI